MTETVYNLLVNITSTVRLKGNKEENKMLDHLTDKIKQVRQLFYENKKRFFISGVSNMNMVEKLDRDYFEVVKDMVNKFYINTEILMTRNKLLFADANDDYLGDKEILDQIKNEYIEN
jgi:ABC-type transporter Mla subunit MlaD